MLILDTCALIELFKGIDGDFSESTQKRIRNEECRILSISFAEIACKVKIGKLELSMSVEQIHSELLRETDIQVIDIGFSEWMDSIALNWKHRDPADRLILAYAQKHQAEIVSSDKLIKKKYKQVLW